MIVEIKNGAFFLIITCLLLISCNNRSKETSEKSLDNRGIVILLEPGNELSNNVLKLDNGETVKSDVPDLIYTRLNDAKEYEIPLNESSETAARTISDVKDFIVLQHKYNGFDFEFFILYPGDSLTIHYKDGKPAGTLLNRKPLKYDVAFHELNTAPPMNLNEVFFKYRNKWNSNEQQEYVSESNKYYKYLLLKLDSVFEKKEISKDYHYLRKEHVTYLLKSLPSDSFTSIDKIDKNRQDTLITYGFYRNHFIGRFNKKGYEGNKINYKRVFDSVLANQNMSQNAKDFLLYHYIGNVIENSSHEDATLFFEKFKKEVRDSTLVTEIKNSYLLDIQELKRNSTQVYLSSLSKKKTTLSEVLMKHKGKVVFIDFWASWCAPCRKAMPDSKKLIREYSDKDVVFMFISIDKNFKDWQKASEQEKLTQYEHSTFAINYPEADFFKALNLNAIPRYLLFDKKGELVYKNAPGPGSDEIRTVLNKYVLE